MFDYINKTINNGITEFKNGTKTMFKEFFNKETNKKQRANMWSFSRLIIPIITFILSSIGMFLASTPIFITSGIIAGFGAVTDYFDGKSSRKHNSASEYGKILDQVTDKIFAGIIGINLLFLNPNYLFILLGELLISIVNVGYKIKDHDLDIKSTKVGKFKEWPLFATLTLGYFSSINSLLLSISNISIGITFLIQLLTSCSYIQNNNKELNKLKREKLVIMVEEIIEEDEEKQKSEELILKKEKTRTDQISDLKKLLNEITDTNNQNLENNITDNEINKQKTKKL